MVIDICTRIYVNAGHMYVRSWEWKLLRSWLKIHSFIVMKLTLMGNRSVLCSTIITKLSTPSPRFLIVCPSPFDTLRNLFPTPWTLTHTSNLASQVSPCIKHYQSFSEWSDLQLLLTNSSSNTFHYIFLRKHFCACSFSVHWNWIHWTTICYSIFVFSTFASKNSFK